MQKINNFWTDENNNKWSCDFYTEQDAIARSATLINCRNCRDCSDCSNCSNCSDCRDCSDCSNCSNCMENPMRYTTSKIGSREGNTTFYYDGENLQVVCGCFRGNLEEFEKKVLETHGNNEVYREQYLKEIRKVKVLFELGWENK